MSVGGPVRYQLGDWLVDPERNRICRGVEERQLQPRAMDVLCLLIRERRVVSTSELLERLWPDRVVLDAAVHQRVAQLRRALGDRSGQRAYIETVSGRGYRICANCEPLKPLDPEGAVRRNLAILPLRDLSADGSLGWLCDGVREHLERQIDVWPQFRVRPGALVNGFSAERPPPDTELLLDGSLQSGPGDELTLALTVIDLTARVAIWSESFSGAASDLYHLQQQLVTSIGRFFGESLGGTPAPSRPEAYAPFLRYLNRRYFGDADANHFWLEETLAEDPDWAWGWGDLASTLMRSAPLVRDATMIERAREILCRAERNQETAPMLDYVQAFLNAFYEADPGAAVPLAESWAEEGWGWPYACLLLTAGLAREASVYLEHAAHRHPYRPVSWEWLAVARAAQGDWLGAESAARKVGQLFPSGWVNPNVVVAWTVRGPDQVDRAEALCELLRGELDKSSNGPLQRGLLEYLGYYPLRFELAMHRGDREVAEEVRDWFATRGSRAHELILSLRLGESAPQGSGNLEFDRYWWWLTRLHITPELASHPDLHRLEAQLGFDERWRQQLKARCGSLRGFVAKTLPAPAG